MADYFSEYTSFIGAKGLPSPADTPYETPGFIRSKRSSRATAGSSREQSASPPPLPPEPVDYRDGKFSAMDPRRFTPTLHASLVSEILNLRRELDSKNTLVENLEITLSSAKTDNEALGEQVAQQAREVRKAKQEVQQMESGAFELVEGLVKERDVALRTAEDLKGKLDFANKRVRVQDEDVARTQSIWENEKESWDNERRQLERRVHVTESRLRMFVDEMSAQQAAAEAHQAQGEEVGGGSTFKDSGIGNESDTASIRSEVTPRKHRRNMSSISHKTRSFRYSASMRSMAETPELNARPNGYSLADELDIDEEDDYDIDEFMHPEDGTDYPGLSQQALESRQSSIASDPDSKAKRVLGIAIEAPDTPSSRETTRPSSDTAAKTESSPLSPRSLPNQSREPSSLVKGAEYVDTGYQPSPPASPQRNASTVRPMEIPQIREPTLAPSTDSAESEHALEVATRVAASPISPPATPVMDGVTWPKGRHMSIPEPAYSDMSTQTEATEPARPKSIASKRDSLSPPMFVPSIAIHPPNSRPSSPRPYVLPPGTKNATTQASMPWPGRDACMQTEEIRVDRRLRKLSSHLLPSTLLPSPTLPEAPKPRVASGGTTTIITDVPTMRSFPSPPLQSPTASSPDTPRDNNSRDLRSLPLRAIPLPRPILAPQPVASGDGPLNRSSQYGVTRPLQTSSQLLDIDHDSDLSDDLDYEDHIRDEEPVDLNGSIPAFSRAPHGRFGLSGPPKVVPEDKELSPDRRPDTADSYGAAPAPSVSSSRAPSQQRSYARPPPAKLTTYKDPRSRSPSFGSVVSSTGTGSTLPPPFPIPTRSSSRFPPGTHSEGSQSPTPHTSGDMHGRGAYRSSRGQHHVRQNSLRKVQSAAVIRQYPRGKMSPQKGRRRKRSPDLTPIQSMAFDTPAPTRFPMPDLPTPSNDHFDLVKGSVDLTNMSSAGATTIDRTSQEAHLVDAIAGTMVGEWMWKYVRKRKSFGIGEDTSDLPQPGQDGGTISAKHGTRHKRWVWLSPYERTIMWDNKQPTTGTALLGKKGRKLRIQSVLDVQDLTPMPKDAGTAVPISRSILILTPARALKFTTTSLERHGLWMTALQFLAQPEGMPLQVNDAPTQPQPQVSIPLQEPRPVNRNRSPSFGRATIRDSVGLTKGRRPGLYQSTSQPLTSTNDALPNSDFAVQDDGADFPAVPRLYSSTTRHQRKRSNTSPRLPQPLNNLRSISSSAIPSSVSSKLAPGSTYGSSIRTDLRSSSSKSGSRRQSIASPDRPNFFEAVGTVRMDAFVDPNVRNGVLYVPAPPPALPPPGHRRHRGDSNLSTSTIDKRRAGYVFDENGLDPFKGF